MTEREKYIAMLNATKEMHQTTINEVNMIKSVNPNKKVADTQHFKDIENMVDEQLMNTGVNVVRETPVTPDGSVKQRVKTKVPEETPVSNLQEDKVIRREIPENEKKMIEELQKQKKIKVTPSYEEFTPPKSNKKFDVIPLPSGGQCYPHKMGKIGVFALTAMDENVILSPNLYRDGLMIDTLLKNRFTDQNIDGDNLIGADRDAITLWLRATGYGNEIGIIATNPNTGEDFETTISLSQIKYKPFALVGDENGEFDFNLPNGDIIKFTFPNRREERRYDKLLQNTEKDIQRYKLNQLIEDLRNLIDGGFSELNTNDMDEIDTICNKIEIIKNKLSSSNNEAQFYSNAVTELEILLIREVNGNRDRSDIREYVENMMIKDIREFRKYVDENTPGLDYNVEITIPKGQEGEGTTFTTLLGGLNQNIFVNAY